MNTQTFQDIFKKSFLNNQSPMGLSVFDILITICISILLAIIIICIYRWSFQGVIYSHSFAVTLLGMSVITCVMIKTISSNIVLSLGMVGALSIVRFRAAIKDPKDIMFVYWSICVGITCGAGLYSLAVLSTLCVATVILLASKVRIKRSNYVLVIRYDNKVHRKVMNAFGDLPFTIKSRVINKDFCELTVEIELKTTAKQTAFISQFTEISGVEYATIVQYSGDYVE